MTWIKALSTETVEYLEDTLGGDPEAWRAWALCFEIGDALFFSDDDLTSGARQTQNNEARKVCVLCPVQAECLAASLMTLDGAPQGVWAGLSEGQRRDLRKGGLPAIRKKVEELTEAVGKLERRTAA